MFAAKKKDTRQKQKSNWSRTWTIMLFYQPVRWEKKVGRVYLPRARPTAGCTVLVVDQLESCPPSSRMHWYWHPSYSLCYSPFSELWRIIPRYHELKILEWLINNLILLLSICQYSQTRFCKLLRSQSKKSDLLVSTGWLYDLRQSCAGCLPLLHVTNLLEIGRYRVLCETSYGGSG